MRVEKRSAPGIRIRSLARSPPQDWSRGMYKHMDHHLRQFGA